MRCSSARRLHIRSQRSGLIPQISNEASDDLKIIIITGFADKDTAIRALQLGAFDLLEKPFQNELLYHSILRALKSLENERDSESS